MSILPWRRALPPTEPQLPGIITPFPSAVLFRLCEACEVTWRGGAKCWSCGRRVPG